MIIELIENKEEEIRVIEFGGCTILSHCIVCHAPIIRGGKWRALCDDCGNKMTEVHRIASFRTACERFPRLEGF
jgi:hypothetical protein